MPPPSPSSVHPRNKKLVGKRLAAAALSLQYNTPTTYLPPTYASATASGSGASVTVTVSFTNVRRCALAWEGVGGELGVG